MRQLNAMSFLIRTSWVAAASLMASALFGQNQQINVSLKPEQWTLSQRNFKIPESQPVEHNAELQEFVGRQCFRLARGLAYTRDTQFRNGIIDVDIAAGDQSRFFGIAFHEQSDDDYEVIFFRPRRPELHCRRTRHRLLQRRRCACSARSTAKCAQPRTYQS